MGQIDTGPRIFPVFSFASDWPSWRTARSFCERLYVLIARHVGCASVTSTGVCRTDAFNTCAASSASYGGEPVLDMVKFGVGALYYVEALKGKKT